MSKIERRNVNPWSWQEEFGFAQATEVRGGGRTLYCAGQTAVDEAGKPIGAGDMRAQIARAMDNLEVVLRRADMTLANVVRLNYYTTDVDGFFAAYDVLKSRLDAAGCRAAGTLLGVQRLAFPELAIEFEATAVA